MATSNLSLTDQPRVLHVAALEHGAQAARTPNECVVSTARPLCDEVGDLHVAVSHRLDIDRMHALPVDVCLLVDRRRLDCHVCAVNRADDVWKACHSVECQLLSANCRPISREADEGRRVSHQCLCHAVYRQADG